MANKEHLAILVTKGVFDWNDWRRNNPQITPDLSDVNLQGMYLEGANFENVNLKGANLSRCLLRWARFDGAVLDEIKIDGADTLNTNLVAILERQKLAKRRRAQLAEKSQETLQTYNQSLKFLNLGNQDIGTLESDFSKDYQLKIEESLRAFVRNGDDIACIGCYVYEYGQCEMCGHTPIKWHYVLENLHSHYQLRVGSECIQNYQIILAKWGYNPEYIVFPNCFKGYTRWILDKNPYAITFNDDIVSFFGKDCEELIKTVERNEGLKHYSYVKRTDFGDSEGLMVISSTSTPPSTSD